MNTGTVSGTLTAPTIITPKSGWALVNIINAGTSASPLVYQLNATTLDTSDSTLQPGDSCMLKDPQGINTIAFATAAGTATADIQYVQRKA